ncbi:glycosyltransferase [Dechloromonas sp. A34]|uniref:glycosyltransferase n=1 Tax=Dechloromonas sp. A34 TaxID=447588 RepID=UPI0022488534|nr:glycosyltransferase [Dechloromonas sp. A34]
MKIIAFPKSGISYNDCFYRALESQGIEVIDGIFSGGWIRANVQPGNWLHLHWPSFEYNVAGGRLRLLLWFFRFVALLCLVRLKGAQLIWTAHNLLPHDRCKLPWLDIFGRRFLIGISRYILVHGPGAAGALCERFPQAKKKLVLIPHGHWIGYYPTSITSTTARDDLGIPQSKIVYLFIGLCKPYKNLEQLITTFRANNLDAILLIAGKFSDIGYRERVCELAKPDSRIHIHEGFIPDDRIQYYLQACDFVVVPYKEILTSGTAMLALSFGKPLISVDLGFLKDVISLEAGILFPHSDPDGLAKALEHAISVSYDAGAILSHAQKYSFDDAARILANTLTHAQDGGTAYSATIPPN